MRLLLGSFLLALALVAAGCGDEEPGAVSDEPAPTPTSQPSKTSEPGGEAVDFELVEAITDTAAGGAVSEVAVPLTDDQAVAQFVSQFENDTLPTKVADAVRRAGLPEDQLL
jgi:hypothetical protein